MCLIFLHKVPERTFTVLWILSLPSDRGGVDETWITSVEISLCFGQSCEISWWFTSLPNYLWHRLMAQWLSTSQRLKDQRWDKPTFGQVHGGRDRNTCWQRGSPQFMRCKRECQYPSSFLGKSWHGLQECGWRMSSWRLVLFVFIRNIEVGSNVPSFIHSFCYIVLTCTQLDLGVTKRRKKPWETQSCPERDYHLGCGDI